MGTTEIKLKEYILSKYKSIREFAITASLPYSTVDNVLKRGVNNVNITTIIKICQCLDISADSLANGIVEPIQTKKTSENTVVITNKNGEVFNYTLTESELLAVLTILDGMKK